MISMSYGSLHHLKMCKILKHLLEHGLKNQLVVMVTYCPNNTHCSLPTFGSEITFGANTDLLFWCVFRLYLLRKGM